MAEGEKEARGSDGEVQGSPGSGAGSVFSSGQPLSRSDVQLLAQAVRNGWDIPEAAREVLPKIVYAAARGIAVNPLTGEQKVLPVRTRLQAVRTMMDMLAQNKELEGPAPITVDGEVEESAVESLHTMSLDDLRKLASGEVRLRIEDKRQ